MSSTTLRTVVAEISEHSTSFHLKLVEFGAKCAARARENGGEEDAEDETVVEDEEDDAADAVAEATITEQAEEEEAAVSASVVDGEHSTSEEREKSAVVQSEPSEAEAPQAELRDRYALGALKRVRYKLDGK